MEEDNKVAQPEQAEETKKEYVAPELKVASVYSRTAGTGPGTFETVTLS